MILLRSVRSEMKNGILARFFISSAVKFASIICIMVLETHKYSLNRRLLS